MRWSENDKRLSSLASHLFDGLKRSAKSCHFRSGQGRNFPEGSGSGGEPPTHGFFPPNIGGILISTYRLASLRSLTYVEMEQAVALRVDRGGIEPPTHGFSGSANAEIFGISANSWHFFCQIPTPELANC